MALEHAILVSLSERPASGLDLTRRFDRSIGFFWSATHQQIYRVLARMEADGWVSRTDVAQTGPAGQEGVRRHPGRPRRARAMAGRARSPPSRSAASSRCELRGASYGDRSAVLGQVRDHRADHATRLAHYEALAARDFPDARPACRRPHLDVYLVLRGGIRLERFWVEWLDEYLQAHSVDRRPSPP